MLWQGNNVENERAFSASTMIFSAKMITAQKAKEIALSVNGPGTKAEDVYFKAGSEAELGIIFDTIREAILTEYWHIYGPYGKPND